MSPDLKTKQIILVEVEKGTQYTRYPKQNSKRNFIFPNQHRPQYCNIT